VVRHYATFLNENLTNDNLGLQTLSTPKYRASLRLRVSLPSTPNFSHLKVIHRHGLSYTTFDLTDLAISQPTIENGEFHLSASVKVANIGSVSGSEVVQLYISLPATSGLTHPELQLRGFSKVYDLVPGASQTINIALDKYAVSYWSELYDTWTVENGVYVIMVGSASDRLSLRATFEIKTGFEWRGL